jgi:hypothetical protein
MEFLIILLSTFVVSCMSLQQRELIFSFKNNCLFTINLCEKRDFFNFSIFFLFYFQKAYYIHKCAKDDPEINECLRYSGNRLTEYLRNGVEELGIVDVSKKKEKKN